MHFEVFVFLFILVRFLASQKYLENIDIVGSGYNAFRGNPRSIKGSDPGIKGKIFSFKSVQQQGEYLIPTALTVNVVPTCSFSSKKYFHERMKEYVEELEVHAHEYGGMSIPLIFGAKFSANEDFKIHFDWFHEGKYKIAIVEATCGFYETILNDFTTYEFTPHFNAAIKHLSSKPFDPISWFEFFEMFGTHYIKAASMGSRFATINVVINEKWDMMMKSEGKVDSRVAAHFMFYTHGKENMHKEDIQLATEFAGNVTIVYECMVGCSNFTISHNEDNWRECTKKSPYMFKSQIKLITDLFRKEYFPEIPNIEVLYNSSLAHFEGYCTNYINDNNEVKRKSDLQCYNINSYPMSCQDIKLQLKEKAVDGMYTIYYQGDPEKNFTVFCDRMSGSVTFEARDYLLLSGSVYNSAITCHNENNECKVLSKIDYTMIPIKSRSLEIRNDDQDHGSRKSGEPFVAFGKILSILDSGTINRSPTLLNLQGTPFAFSNENDATIDSGDSVFLDDYRQIVCVNSQNPSQSSPSVMYGFNKLDFMGKKRRSIIPHIPIDVLDDQCPQICSCIRPQDDHDFELEKNNEITIKSNPKLLTGSNLFQNGYSIFDGNPHATGLTGDPGFSKQQIFDFSAVSLSDDQQMLIPNAFEGVAFPSSCSFSSEIYEIEMMLHYISTLERFVSSGRGWSFFGLFGARFSLSQDYKKIRQYIFEDKKRIISSSGSCTYYDVLLQLPYEKFNFTAAFEYAVKGLSDALHRNDPAPFFKFIEAFGTHYVAGGSAGSQYTIYSIFESIMWKKYKETKIDIHAYARAHFLWWSAGFDVMVDIDKKRAIKFKNDVNNTIFSNFGCSIQGLGNDTDWLKCSKKSPSIFNLKLSQIHKLLTKENFNISNIDEISDKLGGMYDDYCEQDPECVRMGQYPSSCAELKANGNYEDKKYTIYYQGNKDYNVEVYCTFMKETLFFEPVNYLILPNYNEAFSCECEQSQGRCISNGTTTYYGIPFDPIDLTIDINDKKFTEISYGELFNPFGGTVSRLNEKRKVVAYISSVFSLQGTPFMFDESDTTYPHGKSYFIDKEYMQVLCARVDDEKVKAQSENEEIWGINKLKWLGHKEVQKISKQRMVAECVESDCQCEHQ